VGHAARNITGKLHKLEVETEHLRCSLDFKEMDCDKLKREMENANYLFACIGHVLTTRNGICSCAKDVGELRDVHEEAMELKEEVQYCGKRGLRGRVG
jgi:hypothetical protein